MIESSWGGTVAESVVSDASLAGFPEFESNRSRAVCDGSEAAAEWDGYSKQKADWYTKHGD